MSSNHAGAPPRRAWMRSTMVSRPLLPNGQHISDVLGDAFLEAERLTRDGDDIDRDYASIIFAWCESLYRAGVQVIRSSWATSSSISTTTTKPSASASGCHDRQRSEPGR